MSEETYENTLIPIDDVPLNVAVFRYIDGEFIIINFNSFAQKTDKVDRKEIVGKPVEKVFPGVGELGLIDAMLRVHENGGEEDIDLEFYQDERISGWRRIDISRMENGDILVFYKDMTQQQETEEELKSLAYIIDNSMNEVYVFDAQSLLFSYANSAALKNIGYTLEEMQALTPVDIKPFYDKQSFQSLLKPLLNETKESLVFNTTHARKNGETYNVEVRLQLMDFGGKKNFVVIAYDLTDQKVREDELRALGNIIDNSTSEVYIFDLEHLSFSYVNKEALRNTGYTLEEIKSLTPVDIKPDFGLEDFLALVQPLIDGSKESLIFETIHRRKNGQDYNVEIRLQLMHVNGREQFVVMAHDITKRVKMEEMLHRLATIDSLTGIYNRHQINEELDIEIERANRYNSMFALVMLDLDYFKNINDTYGHSVGDYVLKKFSEIVSEDIREVDRFGRWGGEEFILILPELNEEQALHVTEKLRKDVASFEFTDVPQATVSIGVTICHAEDSKKNMLKRVDDAMYQAKKAGRNTIKYI